jgi:diaminohydroxyphosphoribosylaminopyrimidine deaminase / 5-amino-6-(5-phosphoribosylamino)uracil reductase
VFLRRACELAERGRGSTSPNPAVGAVFVLGSTTLGEGFHRQRGDPHAEVEALRDAASRGNDVRGSTLYVTLEPCDHIGSTPPCSQAVLDAGVARVVAGARDPNPKAAGGLERLREANVAVTLADDPWARALIEDFSAAVTSTRPYVRLKLAASLDGFVAPRKGERYWLTGAQAREYVRELRSVHDAVLIGAGTVRVDDPQLTVRPPHARRTAYVRAIACEHAAVPVDRAIFAAEPGYASTIVLAPAGARAGFAPLEPIADVVYVGSPGDLELDLSLALEALRERGIASVLCEGGPTLAARLLERDLVDRIDWLVAPAVLGRPGAVPVLGPSGGERSLAFDKVERLGPDVLLSARVLKGETCSVD